MAAGSAMASAQSLVMGGSKVVTTAATVVGYPIGAIIGNEIVPFERPGYNDWNNKTKDKYGCMYSFFADQAFRGSNGKLKLTFDDDVEC